MVAFTAFGLPNVRRQQDGQPRLNGDRPNDGEQNVSVQDHEDDQGRR
jgi:hypothetical protein